MSRQSLNTTHLVSFQPQTHEAGDSGGKEFSYPESSRLQCRVVQGTSDEQLVGTQREWESSFVVWTSYAPPWKNGDQIEVLAGPTYVGMKLQSRGQPVTGAMGKVWHTNFLATEYRQQLTGAKSTPILGQD